MSVKVKSGFSKENLETYEKDGIIYRKSNGRMIYNPEFHDNYGKKWTKEELAYIAQMRPGTTWPNIGLALGRTQDSCSAMYYKMKKLGRLEYYKNLEEY